LAERGWPINAAAMARGLATARWPGRLERRCFAGRPLLLDGAHNPPAAEALRRELDRLEPQAEEPQAEECRAMERSTAASPRRWLIGIQRHKDAPQLLRALLRPGDALRVTALPEHACWRAAELRDLPELEAAQLEITDASGDLQADLAWLVASAALPVACGSLYLVAELLPLLDGEVPRQVVGNPTD
jgi:dihydrofolate synthase/folylpolyglutamate synthase